jgi:trafficking protein particle complex subunit 3
MTYGSLVVQLMKDYENVDDVNVQLEKMGYKIGIRLIDEYMSKSGRSSCKDIKETAESIAKVGFKMFLNINANVISWNEKETEFVISFNDNPLNDFVELPEELKGSLNYSNILCGVIRGCLEIVQMKVDVKYVKCPLKGDDSSEIKVTLIEYLKEIIPDDE